MKNRPIHPAPEQKAKMESRQTALAQVCAVGQTTHSAGPRTNEFSSSTGPANLSSSTANAEQHRQPPASQISENDGTAEISPCFADESLLLNHPGEESPTHKTPEPNPNGGPRTPEGKAKSSLNNLHHGLTGSFRILGIENQHEFDSVVAALTEEHQPATATELILVEKMAEHLWLSRRAQRLQDSAIGEDDMPRLSIYMRYQTTNDRAFHKCLTELRKLKNEQRERTGRSGVAVRDSTEFVSQNAPKPLSELDQAKLRVVNARAHRLEIEARMRQKDENRSKIAFGGGLHDIGDILDSWFMENDKNRKQPDAA